MTQSLPNTTRRLLDPGHPDSARPCPHVHAQQTRALPSNLIRAPTPGPGSDLPREGPHYRPRSGPRGPQDRVLQAPPRGHPALPSSAAGPRHHVDGWLPLRAGTQLLAGTAGLQAQVPEPGSGSHSSHAHRLFPPASRAVAGAFLRDRSPWWRGGQRGAARGARVVPGFSSRKEKAAGMQLLPAEGWARGGAVARLPEPGGRGRQPLQCGLPQGLTPGAQEHLVDEVAHSPCTLGPAHVAHLVGHKPSTWPQVNSTGPGAPACSRQPTTEAAEATAATTPLQCPRHSIKTSMGVPTPAACSPALGLGGTRSWGSQVPTPQRNMESVLFCMDVKALKHLGPGRKGAR